MKDKVAKKFSYPVASWRFTVYGLQFTVYRLQFAVCG